MNSLYVVVVSYIDGMDILGCYNDYIVARNMILDLIKYKKTFGTEQEFIIYEFTANMNKYIDWEEIKDLEVERIKVN